MVLLYGFNHLRARALLQGGKALEQAIIQSSVAIGNLVPCTRVTKPRLTGRSFSRPDPMPPFCVDFGLLCSARREMFVDARYGL